tara:strand:+ start:4941 stop:5102 length:162 start_codon:yes stop_codon:yes gene_type:complete
METIQIHKTYYNVNIDDLKDMKEATYIGIQYLIISLMNNRDIYFNENEGKKIE